MGQHLCRIKQFATTRSQQSLAELRSLWREMVSAEAPAVVLATAFAVGTLLSMVPVPVLDMMLAALVMRVLHRLPRGPIVAAMALWNSFVMAPVYATSPKVGGLLIATAATHSSLVVTDAMILKIVIGNLFIAAGLALFSFCIAAAGFSLMRVQRRLVPVRP